MCSGWQEQCEERQAGATGTEPRDVLKGHAPVRSIRLRRSLVKTSCAADRGPQHACSACWGGDAAQEMLPSRGGAAWLLGFRRSLAIHHAFSDIGATIPPEYRGLARPNHDSKCRPIVRAGRRGRKGLQKSVQEKTFVGHIGRIRTSVRKMREDLPITEVQLLHTKEWRERYDRDRIASSSCRDNTNGRINVLLCTIVAVHQLNGGGVK